MSRLAGLALKDLKLLRRDGGGFFFTFIFPILFAIFFGFIFRGSGSKPRSGMEVALVCEDAGPSAQQLAKDLESDAALKVTRVATRAEGEALVRTSDVVACVVIPQGYELGVEAMFGGGGAEIEALVDPTRGAEAGLLQGKLTEKAFAAFGEALTDPAKAKRTLARSREQINSAAGLTATQRLAFGTFFNGIDTLVDSGATTVGDDADDAAPGPAWMPVQVTVTEVRAQRDGPSSSFDVSFAQGLVWGLMGCVTAFSISITQERAGGTLRRLVVSPLTRRQILLGKALACFLACIAVQAAMLGVFVAFFGLGVTNWPGMALVLVVNAVGFSGVMMAVAGLSRSDEGAGGMGRALIMILAMIGGGTVPLFLLPGWMQTASGISPFKWSVVATEGCVWRGLSWSELAIPIGVLCLFGAAGFVFGWAALKRTLA